MTQRCMRCNDARRGSPRCMGRRILRKTQHTLTFSHFSSQPGNIITRLTAGAEMSLPTFLPRHRNGVSPYPRKAVVAFLSASVPVERPLASPSASAAFPRGDMAASRDAAAHTFPLPLPPCRRRVSNSRPIRTQPSKSRGRIRMRGQARIYISACGRQFRISQLVVTKPCLRRFTPERSCVNRPVNLSRNLRAALRHREARS